MIRFFALLALLAFIPTTAHAMLAVKAPSTIDRDKVLVGDLFDVSGDTALEPVGDAPQPGQANTFDVHALRRVAVAYDLDWKPTDLGMRTVIRRDSTPVNNKQILDIVRTALNDTLAEQKMDNLDIQLDRRDLEVHLPASVKNPLIKLVDVSYSPSSYRFTGMLVMQDAEQPEDTAHPLMLKLTGRATPQINVPVLSRFVTSGNAIGASDIEMVLTPVNKVSGDIITNADAFKGKELRRDLPKEQWVREGDLRPQQLVRRGNIVTMSIEKGALQISARGRALVDGGVGDTVKVLNASTNRVIEGKVLPNGNVGIVTGI